MWPAGMISRKYDDSVSAMAPAMLIHGSTSKHISIMKKPIRYATSMPTGSLLPFSHKCEARSSFALSLFAGVWPLI